MSGNGFREIKIRINPLVMFQTSCRFILLFQKLGMIITKRNTQQRNDWKNQTKEAPRKIYQAIIAQFQFYAPITIPKHLPSHFQYEYFFFVALINKLYENYDPYTLSQSQKNLQKAFETHRPIISKLGLRKQQITKNEKKIIRMASELQDEGLIRIKNDQIYTYIAYLVMSISGKKDVTTKKLIKSQLKYSPEEIRRLGQYFGHALYLVDMDHNNIPNIGSIFKDECCIMCDHKKWYILSTNKKDLSKIKIKNDSQKVSQLQIERIFQISSIEMKSERSKNQSALDIISSIFKKQHSKSSLTDPNSQIQEENSSILIPTSVKCIVCQKKQKLFDCLTWDSEHYCGNCLISPFVNTTHIPSQNIEKYCRVRSLNYEKYDIICPECGGSSTIRPYHVNKKPNNFTCHICSKIICLRHNQNIFQCFCFCSNCRRKTVYVGKLNISLCMKCKSSYCFNCLAIRKEYCKCVCKHCLQKNDSTHKCEQQCQYCHNSIVKLKLCENGQYVCYECYYVKLEGQNDHYLSHKF